MSYAVLLAVVLCAEPAEGPIRVSPGMQEVVKVPGLLKIALGNQEVADVTVTGASEMLVLGKKKGKTSLTLWVKGSAKPVARMIYVDDGKFTELAKLVKEKVDPTLKAEVFGDKLVIDGELDTVEDYNRLRTLVADQPNVKVLAKLNPRALHIVAGMINAELRKQGLSGATAKVMGDRVILDGTVGDPEDIAKAQMIAEAYYSDFRSR
ncbi:MAG: pilus assembly protein N-terminal domain-containing protein [Deltaproteobacteria bacterium]|nr:pilus assembly protein N-terminal domain-containing protein [Deltaproteobacteria bacterium]